MIKGYKDKKCGLVGGALSHSFSPMIHNFFSDYSYSLFPMDKEELSEFFTKKEFFAVNVTIPYKKDVIPFLSYISPEAERMGAVNTVVNRDGKLYGYNTDYYGFGKMLDEGDISVSGKKVLILGTGGAAKTAGAYLSDAGAREVVFISRKGENNYDNIAIHSDAEVIINCTPVGMYPKPEGCPVELGIFRSLDGVADMIYNPAVTTFLYEAKKRGIKTSGGLSMLVYQAAMACEIFTGEKVDERTCRDVIRKIEESTYNIAIVGMPGCGKSTVGAEIARILNRSIIDTDSLYLELYSSSPANTIEEEGEEAFRRKETEAVKKAANSVASVITTGGGAVTREENYLPLHRNSVIVYLKRDIKLLEVSGRPLTGKHGVCALYEQRRALYSAFADIEVEQTEGDVTKTAIDIISEYKRYIEEK